MAGVSATDRYIWPLVPKERIAAEGPMVLAEGRARGSPTPAGKSYLELSSGITRASSLGYGNEEIAAAVRDQLRKLHYAGTAEYQADVVFELAEKLAELTPGALGPSYFTESGTAANEAAFKLARFYQQATGKPRAYKVISRWNAYHGAIGTPMAVSDWLGVRLPADPGVPGVSFVPGPTCYRAPSGVGEPPVTAYYLDALEQQILHEGPELVAAVIAEPVMQANGVQVPPAGLLPRRARDLRPLRGRLHRRRGDHRLRPHRQMVRDRTLGRPARHDHDGQGPDRRLHAARRGDRPARRSGTRSTSSPTSTPSAATPRRAPPPWPRSGSTRAKG